MHTQPFAIYFEETAPEGSPAVSFITNAFGCIPNLTELNSIIEFCQKSLVQYTNEERENINKNILNRLLETEPMPSKDLKMVPKKCDIYLIKDTARGLHKIGKARNVSNRFSQLKTANACIELVESYKGFESDEKELHKAFKKLRVSGEWFALTEAHILEFRSFFQPF